MQLPAANAELEPSTLGATHTAPAAAPVTPAFCKNCRLSTRSPVWSASRNEPAVDRPDRNARVTVHHVSRATPSRDAEIERSHHGTQRGGSVTAPWPTTIGADDAREAGPRPQPGPGTGAGHRGGRAGRVPLDGPGRQGRRRRRRGRRHAHRAADACPMDGIVVIGEGEKDEAPMLYNGERIGDGTPPATDIAVDPIDGTTLTVARAGATRIVGHRASASGARCSTRARASTWRRSPSAPSAPASSTSTPSPTENLQAVAKAKGESRRATSPP